jgi:hypothetical protein
MSKEFQPATPINGTTTAHGKKPNNQTTHGTYASKPPKQDHPKHTTK